MPNAHLRNDANVKRFLGKHFVALLITYRLNSDLPEQAARVEAISGTVFRIHKAYSYLTAGHCLARVRELLTSDQVEVLAVSLADGFGEGRIDNHPVP
ncbi:MAG: hypothetical protein MI867_23515, partial [Pseudomonadales bacterium]|nr:hypothetical protein [Pseudomonadales bacterium]